MGHCDVSHPACLWHVGSSSVFVLDTVWGTQLLIWGCMMGHRQTGLNGRPLDMVTGGPVELSDLWPYVSLRAAWLPYEGWAKVQGTGGPCYMGGLWKWLQVARMNWVACCHTLVKSNLVCPVKGGPGCRAQVDHVNWVACGYGYRWIS